MSHNAQADQLLDYRKLTVPKAWDPKGLSRATGRANCFGYSSKLLGGRDCSSILTLHSFFDSPFYQN